MLKRNLKKQENESCKNELKQNEIQLNVQKIDIDIKDVQSVLTDTDRTEPCIDRNEEN